MLEQEQVIQEVVENVEVLPVETNSGNKLLKGGLIIAGVIGTVLLVKKVFIPKVKAIKEKKAMEKAQQENNVESAE